MRPAAAFCRGKSGKTPTCAKRKSRAIKSARAGRRRSAHTARSSRENRESRSRWKRPRPPKKTMRRDLSMREAQLFVHVRLPLVSVWYGSPAGQVSRMDLQGLTEPSFGSGRRTDSLQKKRRPSSPFPSASLQTHRPRLRGIMVPALHRRRKRRRFHRHCER